MTTGSNAVAVKSKLIELIGALPAFDGIQVSYGMPGQIERTCVYAGRAEATYEIGAMRGGGRVPRVESLSVDVHALVVEPGSATDLGAAEQSALDLGREVIHLVAGKPTLDDLDGLKVIELGGMALDSGADDEFARVLLTLTFEAQSYLI